MYIYLDIETIPSQRNESRELAAAKVRHPGQMTKPETIAKWDEEQRPAAEDEQWRKTALNGAWGEICCICWQAEDGIIEQATRPTIADSEEIMLRSFFDGVVEEQAKAHGRPIHWVGHNIASFDLRYLWQRAVVLGVQPPVKLRQDATPWAGTVIDTMYLWSGAKGSIKLTELCAALRVDVGHEDTIDGSQVWDEYKAGRFDVILTHCRADVARVREVHRRMEFLS